MTYTKCQLRVLIIAALVLSLCGINSFGQLPDRVTILVDAFGKPSPYKMDWGYSALIEHKGKRILFDTGNDSDLFAHNVKRLGVDLKRLDFVVISHRHGDHTAGLHHLRKINPKVKIYAPVDEHFGGPTPAAFFERSDPSLPTEMRYFGGSPPADIPHGTAWKDFTFGQVSNVTELMPGVRLIPTTSQVPGFIGLRELSLSIDTASGQILVVGCSHSGIERILEEAVNVTDRIRMVFGGLHLVTTSEKEVDRISDALLGKWKVGYIAPGHCTGEHAFSSLRKKFGEKYIYAGVGTAVPIR